MIPNLFRLLALVVLLQNGVQAADGARLYDRADFISTSSEPTFLNKEEIASIARIRSRIGYGKIQVIAALNINAFDSKVLTLVLPGGEEVQYVGEKNKAAVTTDIYTWIGVSNSGGNITVSWGADGLNGHITEDSRNYLLTRPKGQRIFVLAEVIPRQISEPQMPISSASGTSK